MYVEPKSTALSLPLKFMNTSNSSLSASLPLWNRHFLLLSVLAFLLLFVNLNVGDLSGYDDAFHAEEGKAMLHSGDWWTVRHNGELNPEFPPLFYWVEATSMKVFGVHDFAAKLPVALFGFGTILTVYFIAWELTGQVWLALIAMVVLTTTQYFLKYSTHSMTDVPFAFFLTLSMLFYIKGYRKPAFFIWSGLAAGLGMLTRPIVGVIPLGISFIHLVWMRRKDLILSRHVIGGVALSFLLPGIWYGVQYRLHGFTAALGPLGLIQKQATSGQAPSIMAIPGHLLGYPKLLLKLYWPWLPFMVIGLWWQVRQVIRERTFSATLFLVWIVGDLLPFSLGDAKQLRYIMAAFPLFAILAALPIDKWIPEKKKETCFRGLYALGVVAIVFMFFFPGSLMRATDMRKLAPVAEAHSRPDQRVILYTAGTNEWNYENQLLWYSDRYVDFPTTLNEVKDRIERDPEVPVIMDKGSFDQFAALNGDRLRLSKLEESNRFVCFRGSRIQ